MSFPTVTTTLLLTTLVPSLLTYAQPAAPKCWKNLAPIAEGARQEHSAAAIGTDLYIFGGLKNLVPTASVEKLDTIANKWSSIPPLPIALHHPNVVAVGGKLLVLGGLSGALSAKSMWAAVPDCFAYEPASNKWSALAKMPDARGSSAVGVLGNKVFVAGGLASMAASVDVVSVYDAAANKWTSMPEAKLPLRRDHGGGAVVGDTFYVVGGRDGNVTGFRNQTLALNVDRTGARWTEEASIPTARGGVSVTALGGKIYVFGGEGNPAASSRGVFASAESFDAKAKSWTKETAMSNPRHGTAAVAIGDWIYIAGGGAVQSGGAPVAVTDAYGPGPC
jgi:N-acetylneuraminic acid mutarotase